MARNTARPIRFRSSIMDLVTTRPCRFQVTKQTQNCRQLNIWRHFLQFQSRLRLKCWAKLTRYFPPTSSVDSITVKRPKLGNNHSFIYNKNARLAWKSIRHDLYWESMSIFETCINHGVKIHRHHLFRCWGQERATRGLFHLEQCAVMEKRLRTE